MNADEPDAAQETLTCQCCVVGGGPAGMMLGLLFARAGIDVIVIEKHGDFFRDFRGDTIHPSTLEAMADLGYLDEFLKLPHQTAPVIFARVGDFNIPFADFSHLPTKAKFIALMPQWDFLDFLAEKAKLYPSFKLRMSAEADGLLIEDGKVTGVTAKSKANGEETPLVIRADLTVAADGRHSTIREVAGFAPVNIGAPIDVLWFRLSRRDEDPQESFGRFEGGQIMVMINRGAYWQCGYIIAKGSAASLRAAGLDALRDKIAALAPFLRDRTNELEDFDAVKLLTVAVDRLPLWQRPGLLIIGDAAHAMSPIGGVGINLAIQDAIATANLLAEPLLRKGRLEEQDLARVQARREWPTKITQALQVAAQKNIISPTLGANQKVKPPWLLRLFIHLPILRRLPARLVGIGVRPERVRSPAAPPQIGHEDLRN